jgi:hypothetical protein
MRNVPRRRLACEASSLKPHVAASSLKPQAAASRLSLAVKLYVEPMDAVVVEVSAEGRVRLENEDWRTPTLQEKRAIIYAATKEVEELNELLDIFGSF